MSDNKRWLTPLDIPEGENGEYYIQHEVKESGEKIMLANFRNAIFGQKVPKHFNISFPHPTKWHKLVGPEGVWMTDLPIEHRQMKDCIKGFRRRILVGGLGLGLVAELLRKRANVDKVIIVEKQKEVIELVQPNLPMGNKIEIIHDDLFHFLEEYKGRSFSHAFYDIWQSDGEGTFFYKVLPLRNLSKGKIKAPPVCWNEEIMRGQLINGLTTLTRLFASDNKEHEKYKRTLENGKEINLWEYDNTQEPWWNWKVPFWQWYRDESPSQDALNNCIPLYCKCYGDKELFWGTVFETYMEAHPLTFAHNKENE